MSYLIVILVPVLLAVLYIAFSGAVHGIGKLLMALIMAFKFQEVITILPNGILNFLLVSAIFFAFFFLLNWLPRTSRCIDFSCAYIFVSIVAIIVADALLRWLTPEVKVVTIHYLLLFLCSAVSTAFVAFGVGRTTDFSGKILRAFDRIVACLVMGNVISYSGTQIFSYSDDDLLFWILWAAFGALWYVVDIFAFKPFLAACADIEKEVEAEEAVAAAKASYDPLPGETPEETNARIKKLIKEEERLQAKMERREARREARRERREERSERRWEKFKEDSKRWEEEQREREYDRQRWLEQQEKNNRWY